MTTLKCCPFQPLLQKKAASKGLPAAPQEGTVLSQEKIDYGMVGHMSKTRMTGQIHVQTSLLDYRHSVAALN